MFFEKLSLRQKTALLALAKRMMIADAKIRVEEDALYQILQTELGPGVRAPAQDVYGAIDVSDFDDPHSRLVLLLALAIMAYIDDNFHPSESSVLTEVIDQLGFSSELVDTALRIAERQGALVVEVEQLFEDAGV